MSLRRALAVATMVAALVPSGAIARAACCRPSPARHACCAGGAHAPADMAARGCCKTPKEPVPDTRGRDRAPRGVVAPAPAPAHVAIVSTPLAAAPAARLARLGSRAPAPDASPPDLLARHVTLLI